MTSEQALPGPCGCKQLLPAKSALQAEVYNILQRAPPFLDAAAPLPFWLCNATTCVRTQRVARKTGAQHAAPAGREHEQPICCTLIGHCQSHPWQRGRAKPDCMQDLLCSASALQATILPQPQNGRCTPRKGHTVSITCALHVSRI